MRTVFSILAIFLLLTFPVGTQAVDVGIDSAEIQSLVELSQSPGVPIYRATQAVGENINEGIVEAIDAGNRCEMWAELGSRKPATTRVGPANEVPEYYAQLYGQNNCDDLIARADTIKANTGECGTLDFSCHLTDFWNFILESLGGIVWWVLSLIAQVAFWAARFYLWIAASLFDTVMVYLVFNMGLLISVEGGVGIAWGVLRDLANVLLIAGFVMVGFSTILQVASYAADKLLARLIISALLVNFSFFFAGAVIDASNYLATEVYKSSVTQKFCENGPKLDVTGPISLAGAVVSFVSHSDLCSVSNGLLTTLKIGTWASVEELATGQGDKDKALTVIGFMATVFAAMLGFVLFSMAILLISRFVALTILLITSPIGIAGYGLPYIGDWAKKWQDAFVPQALFAPIFFVLLALALILIKSLSTVLDTGEKYSTITTGEQGAAMDVVPLIMFFVISIGFLYTALSVSRSLSERGRDFLGINKIYEKLGSIYGNTYQSTIGGGLQWAQQKVSNGFDRSLGRVTFLGLGPTIGQALKPNKSAKPFGATKTVDEIRDANKKYKEGREALKPLWVTTQVKSVLGKGPSEADTYAKVQSIPPDELKKMSRNEIMKNAKYFSEDQKKLLAQETKKLSLEDREMLATAHLTDAERGALDDIDNKSMDEVSSALGNLSETELKLLATSRKTLLTNEKFLAAIDDQKFKALTTDRKFYDDTAAQDARKKRKEFLEKTQIGNYTITADDRKAVLGKLGKSELVSLSPTAITNSEQVLSASQTRHIYAESKNDLVRDYIENSTRLGKQLDGPGMGALANAINVSSQASAAAAQAANAAANAVNALAQAANKTPPPAGPTGPTGPTTPTP